MKKRVVSQKKSNKKDVKGELVYGAHPIIEALKAKKRKLIAIYTTKPYPKSWKRISQHLPKKKPVTIQYVEREVLAKMTGTKDHMGVVAWMSDFVYRGKMFTPETHPQILLLDSVQDVKNLGAILRSAYCTNFDGVILCEKNGAKITPDSIKASAGLAEHLDIYIAPTLKHALGFAKKAGYNVLLSTIDGEDIRTLEVEKPLCLVIGNEEAGISKDVLSSGSKISLPQKNNEISYNASVAAGILMFELGFKK